MWKQSGSSKDDVSATDDGIETMNQQISLLKVSPTLIEQYKLLEPCCETLEHPAKHGMVLTCFCLV